MLENKIEILELKYPALKKCASCQRNREIYYQVIVKDVECPDYTVSNIAMCKVCGRNFNTALGLNKELDEKIVKKFSFKGENLI